MKRSESCLWWRKLRGHSLPGEPTGASVRTTLPRTALSKQTTKLRDAELRRSFQHAQQSQRDTGGLGATKTAELERLCSQERKEQTPSATSPSRRQRLRGWEGNRRRQQGGREKPSTAAVRLTLHRGGAARVNSRTSRLSAGPRTSCAQGGRTDRKQTGPPTKTKTQSQMTLSPDRLDDLSVL